MQPLQLLSHSPLMDGLCHALSGITAGAHPSERFLTRTVVGELDTMSSSRPAAEALCTLLEALAEQTVKPTAGYAGKVPECCPEQLSAATLQVLWRLLAELLQLDYLGPAQQHALWRLLQLLQLWPQDCLPRHTATRHTSESAASQMMIACFALAASSLERHLSRKELGNLAEAMRWFSCLPGVLVGGLAEADRRPWSVPLPSHDWSPSTLLLADAVLALLAGILATGTAAALPSQHAAATSFALELLFDHRLLFERPAGAEVLQAFAKVIAPDQAQEFEFFRGLASVACHSRTHGPGLTSPSSYSSGGSHLQSKLHRLEHSLHLLALSDEALQPHNLVPELLGLIAELADSEWGAKGRTDADVESHAEHQHEDSRILHKIQDDCAGICCRLAVCPNEKVRVAFLHAIEAEPLAAWLYLRNDFVTQCTLEREMSTGACASGSILRWHQGDAASSINGLEASLESAAAQRGAELREFVEVACPGLLAPSSLAANLRRLFMACRAGREEAALLLWRGEAQRVGQTCELIRFHSDPVGAVSDDDRKLLASYAVSGLCSTPRDLGKLCDLVSNSRLGWSPRALALGQLATLAASDPTKMLVLLGTASQVDVTLPDCFDVFLLTALHEVTTALTAAPDRLEQEETLAAQTKGQEDFLVRLCHTCTLLLVAHSGAWPVDGPTHLGQQMHARRDAFLDSLLPLIFCSQPRLRSPVLQLIACLAFEPRFLFEGCTMGSANVPYPGGVLLVPDWLPHKYLLPVPMHPLRVACRAGNFWERQSNSRVANRAAALCQIFHRLHSRLGPVPSLASLLRLPEEQDTCSEPESHSCTSSVAWCLAEKKFSATVQSPMHLPEAAFSLLLPGPPPRAGPLFSPGYLQLLLSGLAPPSWSPGVGQALIVQPPSTEQLKLLEHLLDMLRSQFSSSRCWQRSSGQAQQTDDRRLLESLQDLAEFLTHRLVPAAWSLLTPQAASGQIVTADLHGRLAADMLLCRMMELLLQVGISLAHREELSKNWLCCKDWKPLLAALVTSSSSRLPRLALGLAVMLPEMPDGLAKVNGENDIFGEALIEYLAAPSASAGSLRHSAELKHALWLAAHFCRAPTAAYVTPWLQHIDATAGAAAWRCLRYLLMRSQDEEQASESHFAERAAACSRALRFLRGAAVKMQQMMTEAGENETQRHGLAMQCCEALELLRWTMEAALDTDDSCKGCKPQRSSYLCQVVESGILSENGALASCLAEGQAHVGLRRVALRLLHALLIADLTVTGPVILKAGLWPRAVAAAAPLPLDGVLEHSHGWSAKLLDTAALSADLLALITKAAACDCQLLLWLATSGPLLDHWRTTLLRLGRATASESPALLNSGGGHTAANSMHQERLFDLLCVHFSCLNDIMNMLLSETAGSGDSTLWSLPSAWSSIVEFLFSDAVAALLAEGLADWLPPEPHEAAMAALAALSGLRVSGFDAAACRIAPETDDLLACRCCAVFVRSFESSSASSSLVGNRGSTGQCVCLANLFQASRSAARAAWRTGFGDALVRILAKLSSLLSDGSRQRRQYHVQLQEDQQTSQQQAMQPQLEKLLWVLRVFFAMLASSSQAREASLSWRIASEGSCGSGPPPLAAVALDIRCVAERNEAVCLELLELLDQLFVAEAATRERGADTEGSLADMLLRTELLPWMMRMSLRRQLASPTYCRVMAILSFCSLTLAISGKQLLLRYLGQMLEVIRALARGQGRLLPPLSESWRQRRLLAALNFVASLSLCPRTAALLAGGVAGAEATETGARRSSCSSNTGLDLWLDIAEPSQVQSVGGAAPLQAVCCAALRILLAIASSGTPHSKAYFVSSGRAIPLLVRLLRTSPEMTAALAMHILWVLAHNNQRAIPLFKRHHVADAVQSRVSSLSERGNSDECSLSAVARNLQAMLA
eukprot:TRINITY_DN14657_c0_g1_i1.p1 TRINITY_DN14657_c0_g1~~TRINITY_DN14657_c0_g1_i1.p1  ORF type:complete len:2205 (-),score=458.87 TRINITY_DN14657_c0_g1_i1:95-5818(-)